MSKPNNQLVSLDDVDQIIKDALSNADMDDDLDADEEEDDSDPFIDSLPI